MRAIVNYASGQWYPAGQERLARSIAEHSPGITVLGYPTCGGVDDAPTHQEIPYAFKPLCMLQALDRMMHGLSFDFGNDLSTATLLWCDASVWAIKDIAPLFEHIEREGHAFFHSGFNVAQYTNDATLDEFDILREEAKGIDMISSGCFGLDMRRLESRVLLAFWQKKSYLFSGAWNNNSRSESKDPYCQGHRHDQSVLSLLAYYKAMGCLPHKGSFFEYDSDQPGENCCLVARGM